jgi:hypothetical protein
MAGLRISDGVIAPAYNKADELDTACSDVVQFGFMTVLIQASQQIFGFSGFGRQGGLPKVFPEPPRASFKMAFTCFCLELSELIASRWQDRLYLTASCSDSAPGPTSGVRMPNGPNIDQSLYSLTRPTPASLGRQQLHIVEVEQVEQQLCSSYAAVQPCKVLKRVLSVHGISR